MSWKCEKCGQKLSGKEKYCPNCATEAVYRCVKCGKELDNGKHRYCPICSTEKSENRKETLKSIGGAGAAVASLALAVVTRGKFGKK